MSVDGDRLAVTRCRCPFSEHRHRVARGSKKVCYLTLDELAKVWLAQLMLAHDMLAQLMLAHDMLAHDMLAQLIALHDADAHDMLAHDMAFQVGSFCAVVSHVSESNVLRPVVGSLVRNRSRPRFGFAP